MPRSPLLHGLSLTVRNPRPLLWTFFFNASLAWLASFVLRAQYTEVTRNSLAAQRMISGFDLGTAVDAARRLNEGPHGTLTASALGVPLYLIVFFLMVPGTLLVYQTDKALGLSGLLLRGIQGFWSFVRITLLTLLVAVPVLGVASVVQAAWANFLDKLIQGKPGFLLEMVGIFTGFLVASAIRLYFDLVEIHTVALGQSLRPNGKPDRRVRKAIKPAWRTFCSHFPAALAAFVALALLGFAAMFFLGLSALRHLGQPRSWPTLVLAESGLFLMLFTRFWQRAMETVLAQQIFPPERRTLTVGPPTAVDRRAPGPAPVVVDPLPAPEPIAPSLDAPDPAVVVDPLPAPEPIAPSLDAPDPGVFHHDVPPRKDLVD